MLRTMLGVLNTNGRRRPSVDGMTSITDATSLEAVVGARTSVGHLKSITFLDDHSTAFLARSPLTVVGAVDVDGGPVIRTVGGAPGVVAADGERSLVLGPPDALDVSDLADGTPIGALGLVPGYGETLRVNGVLRRDPSPRIEVREVFLHCAKAVIRSQLWQEPDPSEVAGEETEHLVSAASGLGPDVRAHLARSRFAAVFSCDAEDHFADGGADVSPKGDPPGFLRVLDERTVAIPDRPGNLRTDTLHNLVVSPEVAVLALVAGDDRVVELRGSACVTDDVDLLAPMEVNGKVPLAALLLDVSHAELRVEPGLVRSRLWDPATRVAPGEMPRGARVWADHVRLNEDPGDEAELVRQLIEEESMAAGLEQNYRDGLY